MTDERSAQDILALLGPIDDEIKTYEHNIALLKADLAPFLAKKQELRADLLDLLTAQGVTGIRGSGLKAAVVKKTTWRITNAHEIRTYLEHQGEVMDFVKLDDAKVIDRAKSWGKPIPGVDHVVTHELRIQEDQ